LTKKAEREETGSARNVLGEQTSPYLRQHRNNPVHWQVWGSEAFAMAERENKPLLLSIGYAACHWCHVMAHESFEDEETAALMNRHFINIKVDREEHPDVDLVYQNALSMMGEQGGWPLTMFLNPTGEPFWGGTYFPKERSSGRPAFGEVLLMVARIHEKEPDKVVANAKALRDALGRLAHSGEARDIPFEAADETARRLVPAIDFRHGGLRGAPKFPQVPIFDLLWRAHLRTGNERFYNAVTRTLDALCQGGIYDHLGGGFARYSTDAEWLVPHFEKMLYDNAQIMDLLTLVWQGTKSPLYKVRIRETADWLLAEMRTEGGGFTASLGADSDGEEGLFYIWAGADIDRVLGPDADFFKRVYNVTPKGNWKRRSILNRRRSRPLLDEQAETMLAECRKRLLDEREKRTRPDRDDKVLADWNGLVIAALARAGAVFGRSDWVEAAQKAFDFIVAEMTDGEQLFHSHCAGKVQRRELLDDYAQMSRAAIRLFEATGDNKFLNQAERWANTAARRFRDKEGGGCFLNPGDSNDLIVRIRRAEDHAQPSGNATLTGVLADLYYRTGDQHHRDMAEGVLRAFGDEALGNPVAFASLLNANETLKQPIQVVIIGDRKEPATQELLEAVHQTSLPTLVLSVIPEASGLPASHPAFGKERKDGRATAYVCRGTTCSAPVTDPDSLREALGVNQASG
jgi:uncharacterized protein YyaL (SSP411 family)